MGINLSKIHANFQAKYQDDGFDKTDDIETLETLSNTLETLNAWSQYQMELQKLKEELSIVMINARMYLHKIVLLVFVFQ